MIKRFSVISLFAVYVACSLVMGQTPFDSFSPETSRPMLVVEDEVSMRQQHQEALPDSMRYTVIVDIQLQAVYLADLSAEQILAIAPLTEEMRNWLSVDPFSDKYPSISPYAYCGWNPVNKIDPDGQDEYEIQWNPEKEVFHVRCVENKDFDQVHIVDVDGNKQASSKRYDYGTITRPRWRQIEKENMFLFDVSGDENASNLFEFLGENFTRLKEAPLEWSRVMVGYTNCGRNIIGTSGKKSYTAVGQYILKMGYTIRGVDHNHPSGLGPSNTDIINAADYYMKFTDVILRVYTGTEYIEYSPYRYNLPEINVKP